MLPSFFRGKTQFLILVEVDNVKASKKLPFLKTMKPEARPKIVSKEWFLDCLKQGEILAASNYKVDLPTY